MLGGPAWGLRRAIMLFEGLRIVKTEVDQNPPQIIFTRSELVNRLGDFEI